MKHLLKINLIINGYINIYNTCEASQRRHLLIDHKESFGQFLSSRLAILKDVLDYKTQDSLLVSPNPFFDFALLSCCTRESHAHQMGVGD